MMAIISIGIICHFSVYSQTSDQYNDLDSIIDVLQTMPDNEGKVDHLISIAQSLYFNNPSKGIQYIQQAEKLANQIDYQNGDIFKTRGNLRYTQGDYMEALNDYLQSLEIFTLQSDILNIANVYNNLGILYEDQNNFTEAKDYYARALETYQSMNDFHGQATIYLNMGWLYDNSDQPDSAILSYNKSLSINKELKDEQLNAILQGNLGRALMHKGSYDSAALFFDRALDMYGDIKDIDGMTETYKHLGELSIRKGNYSKALDYLNEAEELALPHKFKEYLLETYELKSEAYKGISNFQASLAYHEKFKVLSDSIFTAEKDQALYALQLKQEHEAEVAKLNQENQLQSAELKATRFKYLLLVAISLGVLFFMLILTYYFMHKQKTSMQLKYQNLEIINQKREIENQQKDLARVNKDLQSKNLSLNQLNKEKDYLLHVVAHDLKGPLNQMSGLSQVIRLDSENLTESQLNCLEKIDTVSSRLSSMVDKILDIDAIDKKSNNLALEEIDLREVLDETIEEFEKLARDKKIKIKSNLNGKVSLVKIDRQHALQVFENLVSNAIKFSPPNTSIYLNIKEDESMVIAEVKDEGPGLTEEDKKKVFKKFQKLSAQPTGDEDSNGLGLSIVKKYVEAMSGKVWVESDPGNGSSFKVSFKKIQEKVAQV